MVTAWSPGVVVPAGADHCRSKPGRKRTYGSNVVVMTTTPSTTALRATATPAAATPTNASGLSRRGLLAGAAAAGAAAPFFGAGAFTPAAAAGSTLPLVTPVWSEAVRRSYGICAHPTFMTRTYQHADAWLPLLKESGAAYFRGRYAPSAPNTNKIIQFCRANGIKWLMTLLPEDWSVTEAELKARLIHLRDNAADICLAIEGINEPNHERDGGAPPADWAARAVRFQKILWDFRNATPSMKHVKVISPSLWIGSGRYVEEHFGALARAGVTNYIDYAGMHSYPGGQKPDNRLDARLGWVRNLWGADIPMWATETGYSNALNGTSGFKPAPEDVAATYGPRSILTYFERGAMSTRFELLGDPNASLVEQEAHFGLVRTPSLDPSTWTTKPEFSALKNFTRGLRDSAASYTPAPVPLQVTAPSNIKWLLTAKSNGSKTLYAYLNASVYDVVTKEYTPVQPVDVVVVDRLGTRTVKVGTDVVAIPIR